MTVNTQASSGAASMLSTPLARPFYYDKIMELVYERDFLREITNSEISERIKSCAQTIQIMKAPQVTDWRTYQDSQEMVHGQVSATAISFSVCNAAYQALKFSELDIHYACERWASFEEQVLNDCYEKFVSFQRRWVFTSFMAEVSPRNRGNAAGKHGNIALGDLGAPRTITRGNITHELGALQQIFFDNEHWVDNQMFLVVPHEFYRVLLESNFANKAWVGGTGQSTAVDGAWADLIVGFHIYETNHLPFVLDGGKLCYYVFAGHRDAFAYASDIIRSRIVQDIKSFSTFYQMLAVWGGKMIYPEYLALAYWHFDPAVV
jgi:hypothetical protein